MDSMLYHKIFRNLPEEMIHEVLSHSLAIPDHDFCSASPGKSPFAKVTFNDADTPSRAVLEVCKQWYRIGTPLLYGTVVFRSKAQIQALWRTLVHRPELAKYIKKLRVERWYSVVADILKLTPNVTDVWMNLKLYSSDIGKGLAKALLLIDPQRIILKDECLKSRARRMFIDALCERLPCWKKLTCLHYSAVKRPSMLQVEKLMKTLPSCHHLQHIHFNALPEPSSEFLQVLSNHKSLVSIWVRDQNQKETLRKSLESKHPDMAKKLVAPNERAVSYHDPPGSPRKPRDPPRSHSIWPNPLSRVHPIVRTPILTKILRYALGLPEHNDWNRKCDSEWAQTYTNFHSAYVCGNRHPVRYLLVCWEFWRIAHPLLYEVIRLTSPRQCQSLSTALATTDYGRFIRIIVVSRWSINAHPPSYYDGPLHEICSRSPSLVSLVPPGPSHWEDDLKQISSGGEPSRPWWTLSIQEFIQLSTTTGHSLQVLGFRSSNEPCSAFSFGRHSLLSSSSSTGNTLPLPSCPDLMRALWSLQNLRSLIWHCSTPFDLETLEGTIIYSDALPFLERLVYRSKDETFLHLLSPMELPALRTLELPIHGYMAGYSTFLTCHGRKLTSLTIAFQSHVPDLLVKLCPNVKELVIPITGCSMSGCESIFNEVHLNIALTKVVIVSVDSARVLKRATDFLPHLNLSRFYALEEFHLTNYKWPTEQHDIDRSPFVPIAEKFYNQWNVKTLDKSKAAWKPRLKARKAGWNPWKSIHDDPFEQYLVSC